MTTLLTTLAMVLIGIFAFLQKFHPNLPYLDLFSWIPLAMVITPVIMRAIGILPVLHSLLSEVFPTGYFLLERLCLKSWLYHILLLGLTTSKIRT